MTPKMYKFLLQVGLVVAIFIIYSMYPSTSLLIGMVGSVAALYISYNLFIKINGEPYLEVICNPEAYLKYIEQRVKGRRKELYPLYKAYGLIYQGKTDEAAVLYKTFNHEEQIKTKKLFDIYVRVQTHVYYHEGNKVALDKLANYVHNHKHREFVIEQYVETYRLLLKEDYYEVKELLLVLIPEIPQRLFVVEMEYNLALSYYQLKAIEDALAITDFMLEKEYPVVYHQHFKALKEKINQDTV